VDTEATAEEVTRLRNAIWDPWNEYPPVEFTPEEYGWLEEAEPEIDEYLRRHAPGVVKAIERWVAGTGEAIPYPNLGQREDAEQVEALVEDLLREHQIITLAGEEGAGKSTLAHEIAHGLINGTVLGEHAAPSGIERVLIVDVEQTEDDAAVIREDLLERGIKIHDSVFWLDAHGRALDTDEAQRWLWEQVNIIEPHVIIVDTATEAVTKPRDDESVKAFFRVLGGLLRRGGVRGIILLGQARKRSQEAEGDRAFDDLFGSRVWKGRSSAVFWIEGETFTVWKQRPNLLEKRWGGKDGRKYAQGRLIRTEGETLLLGPLGQEDRRTSIIETVREHPGQYSKTGLIKEHFNITSDLERARWARDVDNLVATGVLDDSAQYKKLRVVEGGHFARLGGA